MNVYTPGPWETQERDDRERGIAVIAVHSEVPSGSGPTRGMVAWVGQGGANFGKPKVQEANARIIAAVPDLIAALKALRIDANRLCDRMLGGSYEADCRRAIAVADAAIAKAEGRS